MVCGGGLWYLAPGAEGERRQQQGTQRNQTQNGHFRRQIQSSLASERSILEPKGTKKHPTKNSRAFPLVFGVKNRTMRSASSQQKIDERFPPSEGLKWQFRSASDQKNAQKKNEHSAAFIARQQTGGILSHVRRTFGLGAKIHEENPSGMALAQPQPLEVCGTRNAKRWGNFWGCPEDSYPTSTLALEHQVNGLSHSPLQAYPPTPTHASDVGW